MGIVTAGSRRSATARRARTGEQRRRQTLTLLRWQYGNEPPFGGHKGDNRAKLCALQVQMKKIPFLSTAPVSSTRTEVSILEQDF